ncbi:MAG: ATP-binding cassette domain-containing protein [Actinophytocola sp.]|uniref:ABC transporter ATP-binding protein n=1 Tax=Actinophytocola sp. TaxID=1872138 RepID=UPI00132910E3|nr:ABC transporter ATP-binding protein [Actinophytocola sp.]MPZ79543.1 ATP-binding cassette domain-containing protein [Actinophytocola sp.]
MGSPVSSTRAVPRRTDAAPGRPLLEVRDLRVEYRTSYGLTNAVNGLSYSVNRGETLAILGESGSGKSVAARAVLGIIESPPGYVTGGEVLFDDVDLLTLSRKELRRIRGERIAIIFQDALTALNPVFTVGFQIAEMFRVHRGLSHADASTRAAELLDRVRIPNARNRIGDYPHQFSGGMRQRVMIAMAIALEPDLLIADEPTTALDVTVQAQIMALLAELRHDLGMGLVLITHDLGVVAEVADHAVVMYAGRGIEYGSIAEVYDGPAHPYTRALMRSIPRADQKGGRLEAIDGSPPNLSAIPAGCEFHPRCPLAEDMCATDRPDAVEVAPGRRAACHFGAEVVRGER